MRVRRAVVAAVAVLLAAGGCGVRPEGSPRLLDGADATSRLPVPTVAQQPDADPTDCPLPSSEVPVPSTTPAAAPVPTGLPTTTPAPPCPEEQG